MSHKGQEKQVITISFKQNFTNIVISIRDNGPGISPDILDKIFNPFFTTKGMDKGTGIGLSLSHSFILEMKGELKVKSSPREGTEFTIELPLVEGQTEILEIDDSDHDRMDNRPLLQGHVLLVDDEEDIRQLLAEELYEFSLEVTSAKNGSEALDIYTQDPEQFDIIISDMQMPVMDGPTLLTNVRSFKNLPQPRFIFITGGINSELIEQNNQLYKDVDAILYKPFDEEKMWKVLSQCLERKKALKAS